MNIIGKKKSEFEEDEETRFNSQIIAKNNQSFFKLLSSLQNLVNDDRSQQLKKSKIDQEGVANSDEDTAEENFFSSDELNIELTDEFDDDFDEWLEWDWKEF